MRCERELREIRGIVTRLTRQSDIRGLSKGFAPPTLKHYHEPRTDETPSPHRRHITFRQDRSRFCAIRRVCDAGLYGAIVCICPTARR